MNELRDLLPGIKDWNYFNYAAAGPLLKPSSDLLKERAEQNLSPPSLYRESWLRQIEETRASCAELIGASPEEIAFVTNTGAGLNFVANAIHWKAGDRILFPEDEFPTNRIVWENLAAKGVSPEAIPVDPKLSFADQLAAMDLNRVRLIAVSAISYCDGRAHDLGKISQICKKSNAYFSIDAIQALGTMELDLRKTPCDFLSTASRKWLFGPHGAGFLYIKQSRLPELFVSNAGWLSVKKSGEFEAKATEWEFADSAKRFESGLLYSPAIHAMGKSIQTLKAFGWPRIFQRIEKLHGHLKHEIQAMGYTLYRPDAKHGILVLKMGEKAGPFATKCAEHKLLLTERKGLIRISLHATTLDKEVELLLQLLKRN